MVSRHGKPDCIVPVKQFVCLHDLENRLLDLFKYAELPCTEEVGLREVPHNAVAMSKYVECTVHMAQREFGVYCLDIDNAEH